MNWNWTWQAKQAENLSSQLQIVSCVFIFFRRFSTPSDEKQYFLQRNPGHLNVLLGKVFVFAFTWSFGGNLRRQDESEASTKVEDEEQVDIAEKFDNFVHELFEVEPPVGKSSDWKRAAKSSHVVIVVIVDGYLCCGACLKPSLMV